MTTLFMRRKVREYKLSSLTFFNIAPEFNRDGKYARQALLENDLGSEERDTGDFNRRLSQHCLQRYRRL